ncbi:exodeoxyribonuclease VII large subunit [Youxingia wuxianensis]|uniref:Exodeoxyribonuclease 7 large subunit n=1 Tax=Youxingia wuxianensis TaxID=2763678 RepID=A0A926IGL1_9FIRM|nr:exodeoxyribonuclease VII large subunit [Youxingia wuxianensis]MBC8584205.1 exodeoxyribonuclease VII large subunit [Youxingia wuxianensis]
MKGLGIVTVSQLNRYAKSLLEGDQILSGLMVKAEISNFVRHYKSGHMYFTLKDDFAAIKAVMFRGYAEYIKFTPENGMSVIVTGSVSLYERDGSYQFYVTDMQPEGLGSLQLALEQLKEKLSKEGLFSQERKRPLPHYPETIGIITSEGAAALQDILNILSRRYPAAKVLLYPALVQGAKAAQTLIDGLYCFNKQKLCDVIILGRGGGSLEDLWAFNDENLARAIAASEIPVISAVGHETDVTIADLAADVRAPTPSAAAELVAPNLSDVRYYLDELHRKCASGLLSVVDRWQQRLDLVKAQSRLTSPMRRVQEYSRQVEYLSQNIREQMERKLEHTQTTLRYLTRMTESVSPVRLLERGYSVASIENKTVTSISQIKPRDLMITQVKDGQIISQVLECRKNEEQTI